MRVEHTVTPAERRCPTCGGALPADTSAERCPRCMLRLALGTEDGGDPAPSPARDSQGTGFPEAGEPFGHYRILRRLGQGGMGAVFEAEDLDNGRRVALKVLSHALDSPDARQRFFREGRLAASINHPNSVYVFGTEEIGGTPVISMELVPGGTLQERIAERGPLPVAEAVDAVLQAIEGLEAAQRIGVLHRDIKPSNCFVDAEGQIKVGDFGLSISTAVRTESNLTVEGAYLGTPAFSAPEQLRGDVLTVRSDIYSVGVTLYYLLTGKMPFEAAHTVQLLATVLEKPAESPARQRAALPRRLCQTVLRCLEKNPDARFQDYAGLRAALLPYASTAPSPATVGLRFLAGLLDLGASSFISSAIGIAAVVLSGLQWVAGPQQDAESSFSGWLGPDVSLNFSLGFSYQHLEPSAMAARVGLYILGALLMMAYYAVPEGLAGASLGKWICGLRVTGPDRNVPGLARAFARAALFCGAPYLAVLVLSGFDPGRFLDPGALPQLLGIGSAYYIAQGLLFCTVRRHNGFAAAHDLATGTRVVRKPAREARVPLVQEDDGAMATDALPTVGPYHVLGALTASGPGDWRLGYDARLLRKVWLHVVPPGTPPVDDRLKAIGRVGRLRWISGRRSEAENWDAYEAPGGKPLGALIGTPQPWEHARYWLLDLANEIAAAERDGTLPRALGLDRVWITADGRAKLLDFQAPGSEASLAVPPSTFLEGVARAALGGGPDVRVPIPLHARRFLETMPTLESAEAVVANLKPLLHHVACVTRRRRAALVAGCVVLPILLTVFGLFMDRLMEHFWRSQPAISELVELLNHRRVARMGLLPKSEARVDDRSLEIYIASHYRHAITNPAIWQSFYANRMITGTEREFCEQSLVAHPEPDGRAIADAAATVGKVLRSPERRAEEAKIRREPWFPLAVGVVVHYIFVAIPALVAAALFRSGLAMLVCGVAVVRADGLPASRLRVLCRSLVAWGPFLVFPFLWMGIAAVDGDPSVVGYALSTAVAALSAVSVALRGRGLQDRVAGTCLVPR